MFAQCARKYGAKARYQGEEAGKGQADRSNEVSAAKIVRGGGSELVELTCPAAPPATDAQVARAY